MGRDYRANPGRLALPGLQGRFMVDTFRGTIRVRSWPKERGVTKNPIVKANQEWFGQARKVLKRADPEQRKLAMQMTKGTGLYPDDLLMMGMAGNLGPYERDDGHLFQKKRTDFEMPDFLGVVLNLDAPLSIGAGANAIPSWPLPVLDQGSWWNVSDPTLITIPEGVDVALLWAGFIALSGSSGASQVRIWRQDGTLISRNWQASNSIKGASCITSPLVGEAGNSFYMSINPAVTCNAEAGPATFFAGLALQVGQGL